MQWCLKAKRACYRNDLELLNLAMHIVVVGASLYVWRERMIPSLGFAKPYESHSELSLTANLPSYDYDRARRLSDSSFKSPNCRC